MNRLTLLILGIFAAFSACWIGLVLVPYLQLGHLEPHFDEEENVYLPPAPSGLAAQGRVIYAQMGCVYCHTQQVRPANTGSDILRNWGERRTVARDYVHEQPAMLGTMRTGPDLANIGARQDDEMWHYAHLYNPRITSPGSIMPPHRFLFKTQRVGVQPSPDALVLPENERPEAGYEVVPTQEARALVAYLLSMNRNYELPEAKIIPPAE